MLRITHPRPEPGRQEFIGVTFHDGVATVESLHPERELALTQHGYTIEPVVSPPVDEPAPEEIDEYEQLVSDDLSDAEARGTVWPED